MERPPILDETGLKFSENVKGFIRDRENKLVGLVLVDETSSYIFFLGETSLSISINRETGQINMGREKFVKDPKELLWKLRMKDRS